MILKEIIEKKLIWKTKLNNWYHKCPKCQCILESKGNKGKYYSAQCIIKNTLCCKCSKSSQEKNRKVQLGKHCGNKNSMFEKKHTKETILKNSEWHQTNIAGNKNPFFGKHHTEETKKKISNFNIGRLAPNKGKSPTKEAKQNMRISKLNRLKRLNIHPNIDEGSEEWFEKYNRDTNSNFKPKRFLEIGYIADGYDEEKHEWMEYDTKYHNFPHQKKKDVIRQNNIIKYFENIGKPLNKFSRVRYDNIITRIY